MLVKEIVISRATRNLINDELIKIGVDGENLQEKLIFKFDDGFVNGTARIEILMQDKTKSYVTLEKVNETYELPIKSILTKKGLNYLQLVISEGTEDEDVPIFKSEKIPVYVSESIKAIEEAPEGYDEWIDVANTKLNQMDNFDIEAVKEDNTATITITNRYGEETSVEIQDGEKGDKGDTGPAGRDGIDGQDGITPTIGNNGNWYLGNVDTGKPSRGIQGERGERGEKGEQGIQGIQGERGLQGEQGIPGQNGTNGRDGYVQYTAGDNITIENNVISALGGVETQKIPNYVYLDTITPGIYFYNKDISYTIIKQNQNTDGWNYYKPFLLIVKENYNPEIPAGEPIAVVYYSGTTAQSPSLSFTEFYNDSQGNITRENAGAGSLLNSLSQNITGVKTFNSIPQQNGTTAPTLDYQFTNKKYVDDMIASISGGGDVVEKVTTSTSEPFVFEGKKKGLYYITNSSAKFHYKVTETSSVQSNNLRTIFLFLISDFGEITSGTFAHTIYINPSQGGNNGNLFIGNCTISNGNIVLNSQSTKLGQIVTTSDQQIDGIKTFTSLPLSSVVPTMDTQLANKKYVDDSISSAIGNINTILATLTTPSNGGE